MSQETLLQHQFRKRESAGRPRIEAEERLIVPPRRHDTIWLEEGSKQRSNEEGERWERLERRRRQILAAKLRGVLFLRLGRRPRLCGVHGAALILCRHLGYRRSRRVEHAVIRNDEPRQQRDAAGQNAEISHELTEAGILPIRPLLFNVLLPVTSRNRRHDCLGAPEFVGEKHKGGDSRRV